MKAKLKTSGGENEYLLSKDQRYLNRELSWLQFNRRILEEATDPSNPLLERLNFFCIGLTNLDEFFEIRVAAIKQQIEAKALLEYPDGMSPFECLGAIRSFVRELIAQYRQCWIEDLLPALKTNGIYIIKPYELPDYYQQWLRSLFQKEILPLLTPMVLDPAHPCPLIPNKAVAILLYGKFPPNRPGGRSLLRWAIVTIPHTLPTLIELPTQDRTHQYVFIYELVKWAVPELFPGVKINGTWLFRVTRNSELYVREDEYESLLAAVEIGIRNRRRGAVVRVETERGISQQCRRKLQKITKVDEEDIYEIEAPLDPLALRDLYNPARFPSLCFKPFVPSVAPRLRGRPDIFAAIKEGDILLHHPYESFESVIQLLEQAAQDPNVFLIKQTLYRTGGDPRIIQPLKDAAMAGKQVTVIVELKARFDEEENMRWAKELQELGANVIYGVLGLKVHCKMLLIVRRESNGLQRYVHISTGNYNPKTAFLYTDLGLMSADPRLGEEVAHLFNVMTGLCGYRKGQVLLAAPFELHERFLDLINRERYNALKGLPARIIAKMNGLTEPSIIDALYQASEAGVKIDLIVRGICCLRPGVPGLSSKIEVRSIIGRFLEHARIYYFENAGQPELYVGSADWMPRNLFRRIETVFLIQDDFLRTRIINEILMTQLKDNKRTRLLQPDGSYLRIRPAPGELAIDSQQEFLQSAIEQVK